ncbi:protein Z-dependent protease inhibitor-like [Belonocnema kinseyi]|uniref:protein Z-dependent protease inhibitor-like n=1 Tax=Belonocnema kinseyi TaxID=2817044 RepID=UPI00143D0CFB|nr:protein Z-dependent protease inhibitor-like [Belonocnema kinseyi]
MRTLLMLFGALVAIGISKAAQTGLASEKKETCKCCKFAFQLYQTLAKKSDGNIALATLSAFDSLYLLSNGARGNTAKQIRNVLNDSYESVEELSHYKTFTKSLTENSSSNFIQALFIDKKIEVSPDFKNISSAFITKPKFLNLEETEEASAIVEKYFEDRSTGNLKEVSRPLEKTAFTPQSQNMFIQILFAYSGRFLYPFNPRYTENRPFCKNRDSKKSVPTMFARGKFRGILIPPSTEYSNSFRVIEIPYEEEFSLLVFSPLNSYQLDELEHRLDSFDFSSVFNSKQEDIALYLPKFNIFNGHRLKLPLREMGMTDAFDNSASFGGISSSPLHLEDIFIKTYFSVDETGTKVEALLKEPDYYQYVTQYASPLVIDVNRPFLFSLVQKRGNDVVCILNGRVYNPEILPSF